MSARKRKAHNERQLPKQGGVDEKPSPQRVALAALAAVLSVAAALIACIYFVSSRDRDLPVSGSSGEISDPPSVASPLPEVSSEPPATIEAAQEEALEVADRLTDRFAEIPQAWAVLGQLHIKLSNANEAERCWQRCLELDPGFVKAYLGLAAAAEAKAELPQGIEVLRKAGQIAPHSIEVRHRLARLLLSQGNIDEAIGLLEKNAREMPESYDDWHLLGEAYTQAKDYEKVKASLEKAIAIRPTEANTHYMLARACARLGLRDQAAEHQGEFTRLQEERQDDRRQNYLTRTDLGEMCETDAATYVGAGDVYASQGDLREAEWHWLRGAAIAPMEPEPRRRLGTFYLQANRLDEAIQIHQDLVKIEPDNVLNQMNLGTVFARAQQFEAAEGAFGNVVRAAPDAALGYTCLARLYLQLGKNTPKALEYAQTAVRLEPTAIHHALLAVACEKNGDLKGAWQAARHAAEQDPDSPQYLELLRRYEK